MDIAERRLEDQENNPLNNDELGNNTGPILHRNLTVDELTQLVQRYNLPERSVADAATFQRVLF